MRPSTLPGQPQHPLWVVSQNWKVQLFASYIVLGRKQSRLSDLLSFPPTHPPLLELPHALAGSKEAHSGGTRDGITKPNWQPLPEKCFLLRYQTGPPLRAAALKQCLGEPGPSSVQRPPFAPLPIITPSALLHKNREEPGEGRVIILMM